MGTKLPLTNLANLESESTAVQTINANFQAVSDFMDRVLNRDGTLPNTLTGTFDMNSNRLINLPLPVNNTEPLRLMDVGGVVPASLQDGLTSLAQCQAAATAAAASAAAAAAFVGSATSAAKWTTPRTITLSGDVTGTSPTWDGSTNLAFTGLTIATGAVTNAKMASGAALANLGYTPLNVTGGTVTGDIVLNYTPGTLSVNSVGFRGVPINNQNANYTFAISDVGMMVRHTDGNPYSWTVNPVATTAYPVGAALAVRNVGSGVITIVPGAGVSLRKAGSSGSGSVTLAQWGSAAMIQEDTNVWVISGLGIS